MTQNLRKKVLMLPQRGLRFPLGPPGLNKCDVLSGALDKRTLNLVFGTEAVKGVCNKAGKDTGDGCLEIRARTRVFFGSQHVNYVYFCFPVCDNDLFPRLPLCVHTQEFVRVRRQSFACKPVPASRLSVCSHAC